MAKVRIDHMGDSVHFDLILVGSGFASAFFLDEYLRHAAPNARILVLEWGKRTDHAWQVQRRAHSEINSEKQWINLTPQKPWLFNVGFGGGGCWTGNTPRMHPNDFRTKSLYGVGEDWPLSYEDLEPFYVEVEERMGVAGASGGPYPRSKPYPLPAHRMNAFDLALQKKYPDLYLPMPSARASQPYRGRPGCCGNGVCSSCPIGAKFQVDLHMTDTFADPRVEVRLGARVEQIEIQAGVAQGARYRQEGKEHKVTGDVVAVGAHAIMTPWLLLRSGLDDAALGRYLNEQIGRDVTVLFRGLKNFGGVQANTGFGAMFIDGAFRKEHAGCLLENWNVPWLRAERGRWREKGFFKLVFEDEPQADAYVAVSKVDPERPEVHYARHSDYLKAGFAKVPQLLEEIFADLPVESYHVEPLNGLETDAHIQGTTRMGIDPKSSVVDGQLRHHRVRNLLALGSNVFPTCPAANPTLTLSALSMRAARQMF